MSNDNNNNNVGAAIARIIALTGGAIAGTLLANWLDKTLTEHAQQKSEYDRSRYAQGLSPQQPLQEHAGNNEPRIIRIEEYASEEQRPE